ncbi:DVU_1551 family NTP transferase [Halodesulfovibrio marinisediminis]|uniref:CTP:molybdopterin cytidylyltransferase MocA n=1 Tax=Halodesulfovibrio marinisediminis DSM 17456 TaxID=1121457 RepID=A0A1N6GWH0_9BACT|nr:NTP transferase domain-containing protein [Halodesulfovibrio marinisediminis]SIO11874.1 CTP:molybdopterin cytidylyltransferase MocA [Halodesulfovibrio marinisediminis DSM 17456]
MLRAYAILLAAGYGSRMGQCKPLLSLGENTALQVLAESFIHAGVTPIVVTGYAREQVEHECNRLKIQAVYNANFNDGMFSSVQAGCNALPEDAELFFVTPVDVPLIRPRTISELLAYAAVTEVDVIHPILDDSQLTPLPKFLRETEGKRGHPPCMRASLKKEILQYNGEGGLTKLLDKFSKSTQYLPVLDSGMLLDMDTPEDYKTLCQIQKLQGVPSLQECYAIWNTVKLPTHIRKHSTAVTDIVRIMLEKLPEQTPMFKQTVLAGAMLHDIAKGSRKHALAGANLITEFGFPALAPCIAAHSHLQASEGAITEAELIFLADKFVEGTSKCTLKKRYDEKMACFADSPEVVEVIRQRLQQAQAVLAKLESATGLDFNMLLTTNGSA